MSWHFSRGLVEDFLEHISLASEQFALSSEMRTASLFLSSDKTKECFTGSLYGMTCVHLPEAGGEELLTSYLADSRVRRLAPLRVAEITPKTYGQIIAASYPRLNRPMCSPRMSPPRLSRQQPTTLPTWATKPKSFPCPRLTWVRTTFGSDSGFLHTPTTKANYSAQSMQKWPACREFVRVFGKPSPQNQEWMMGYPDGWTDTKPVETAKYRSWLARHYGHLRTLNTQYWLTAETQQSQRSSTQ